MGGTLSLIPLSLILRERDVRIDNIRGPEMFQAHAKWEISGTMATTRRRRYGRHATCAETYFDSDTPFSEHTMFDRSHPLAIWLGLALLTSMTSVGRAAPPVSIWRDQSDPAIAFAVDELRQALVGRGHDVTVASGGGAVDAAEGLLILLAPTTDRHVLDELEAAGGDSPQDLKAEGFVIRRTRRGNATVFWVLAADTAGLMYGALDLAEVVRCHGLDGVKEVVQNPYMALRGIKYNCPLDERTPTYHAHGGEAQWNNVAVMWEMDFWKEYLDQLARFRYNYLSLWNLHPFPSMVRVPGYEKVAVDDVQTTTGTIRMTMDEKIAFWREVMRYAKERNVDVYVVTWNIFVLGTDGQYGLTNKFDNPTTTDYFRKSVKQMFLTYPDLAGVGLTTGERMPNMSSEQKEDWAFNTYGQGVLDAATEQPDRKITLIHRQHQTGALDIAARFQELVDHPNIDFLFSFKYAKAHVMSSTRQPYCDEFVREIAGLETIWTLRNDSNYYFRWGAPTSSASSFRTSRTTSRGATTTVRTGIPGGASSSATRPPRPVNST